PYDQRRPIGHGHSPTVHPPRDAGTPQPLNVDFVHNRSHRVQEGHQHVTSTTARRRLAPAVAAGIAALVISACGSDPDTTDNASDDDGDDTSSEETEGDDASGLSGTLNGAGASAQEAAVQAWVAGFQTQNPDVTVNYAPEGSGAGREQFTSGAVAFAGSDAAMDEEEMAAAEETCG